MWAQAPETDGVTCELEDPVARALCERPELRGLLPAELARELGVSAAAAQVGVLRLARQASGVRVMLRGVSFDEAIASGGRMMGRNEVAYAPDARGLATAEPVSSSSGPSEGEIIVKVLAFLALLGLAFAGLVAVEKKIDQSSAGDQQ